MLIEIEETSLYMVSFVLDAIVVVRLKNIYRTTDDELGFFFFAFFVKCRRKLINNSLFKCN